MIENKYLCFLGVPAQLKEFLNVEFRSFQRVRECNVSPPLKQQLVCPCLLALSAVSPQYKTAVPYQTLDFCLWETFILSYQLFFFSFRVLWTLSCEHIECTAPVFL